MKIHDLFMGISRSDVYRPHGEIDILLGTNYSDLLLRVLHTNKGLQLLENQYGFSFRGRHDEVVGQLNTSNHIHVKFHKLSSSVSLSELTIESNDTLKNNLGTLSCHRGNRSKVSSIVYQMCVQRLSELYQHKSERGKRNWH